MTEFERRGLPNPGSPEAVADGCACSAHLNRDGAGYRHTASGPVYVVVGGCPVHTSASPQLSADMISGSAYNDD